MPIKRITFALLFLTGCCFWITPGLAQQPIKGRLRMADSTFIQIVKTIDGSSNVGSIIQIDSVNILLQTSVTAMTIPIVKITEIKEIPAESIKNGEYWFSNPNATRLFFGPTAQMLKKGQGYFSDTYIFFPQVVFGLTDNITLGGGISLFPGGGGNQIIYLMPKVGMPVSEKFHLAGGALIIKLPDLDQEASTVGVLYGAGTYGGPDRSFTAGLGYGFAGDEMADRPMVMVGGEHRLSRRVSFVTENWLFPGLDQPLVSAGFRFFGEGLAVDLALANVLGEDMVTPGIPFIDFVYNF
ncbi:MAG: hypothetical protein A2509_04300 [Candidatus Edwardsbacteria bacterium RIFOXYD12_FULL_50_11]|uniref:Uncharacterized protein n=1 Tax=Candidatus Edwardsbacteria bacterium GWF2_54_11 TaxID=1817851 RepID=A0A1F5RFF6_9BACT|nr:MAG: hypothetical protein A2502_05505 [Candidatus Edwardsbacteria bacterium RifOxyC12_full_54_24]OGF07908.1 MAG: hypothetical protein A2273_05460 [Candidatus Edwardsbacteria bacterium RifOxyA12_full_54_48]OGF10156.1 MAG: hypothetical protein A3K15_11875 [Candidatus Edwardsbacteria bacterium GWE2_54_12]OGF13098.1 MAG: hypothetical protein A2024_04790 [Candidatus Edwardsbacteria bacterium GWF2_54_11]OGF15068.1 MAG: hypothetical protein A2509_04300 [Candidatus Edwardsbacteria bacterium RIFOXYD1